MKYPIPCGNDASGREQYVHVDQPDGTFWWPLKLRYILEIKRNISPQVIDLYKAHMDACPDDENALQALYVRIKGHQLRLDNAVINAFK